MVEPTQKAIEATQKSQDVSDAALKIARMLDRLYPGKYMLMITRPDEKGQDWRIEIFSSAKIQDRNVKEQVISAPVPLVDP
jgi:hypothetical protein